MTRLDGHALREVRRLEHVRRDGRELSDLRPLLRVVLGGALGIDVVLNRRRARELGVAPHQIARAVVDLRWFVVVAPPVGVQSGRAPPPPPPPPPPRYRRTASREPRPASQPVTHDTIPNNGNAERSGGEVLLFESKQADIYMRSQTFRLAHTESRSSSAFRCSMAARWRRDDAVRHPSAPERRDHPTDRSDPDSTRQQTARARQTHTHTHTHAARQTTRARTTNARTHERRAPHAQGRFRHCSRLERERRVRPRWRARHRAARRLLLLRAAARAVLRRLNVVGQLELVRHELGHFLRELRLMSHHCSGGRRHTSEQSTHTHHSWSSSLCTPPVALLYKQQRAAHTRVRHITSSCEERKKQSTR